MADKKKTIIGQFTGKCCDSEVFNNNGMHLSKELFNNLFDSEEYKRSIELGHYIGYLGHPEDPECQDYQNACIVMRESHFDGDEIVGTFDLIDTPVGRIVKAFIDAGVKFGISIRGLGEVASDGEVDPEDFTFRGYDLVTFPAYNDCIPEFQEIAASTDGKKRAQYKKVCAAIETNLPEISSVATLKTIQDQLNEASDEYKDVTDRISEIEDIDTNCEDDTICIDDEKINALTELYLDARKEVKELTEQNGQLQVELSEAVLSSKKISRQFNHYKRVLGSQLADAKESYDRLAESQDKLRSESARVRLSASRSARRVAELEEQLTDSKEQSVTASNKIATIESNNLKYQRKIEAQTKIIEANKSTISGLEKQVDETVTACNDLEARLSDLDKENEKLTAQVEAAQKTILSYQQAYANMFANALGVQIAGLPVTAETTVEEIQDMICAGTSTSSIGVKPDVAEVIEGDDEEDEDDEPSYNAGLVTI